MIGMHAFASSFASLTFFIPSLLAVDLHVDSHWLLFFNHLDSMHSGIAQLYSGIAQYLIHQFNRFLFLFSY